MSKPKDSVKVQIPHSQLTTYSYSIARKDSGYYITKHTIVDSKIVNSEQVSEPDVWAIMISNLSKIIKKEI